MSDKFNISSEELDSILDNSPLPETVAPSQNSVADLSDADLDELAQDYQNQKKYGGRPGEAMALSALSGATFSLSDRALIESGLMSQEELQEIYERNPEADLIGSTVGAIAPILLTGGAAAPATIGTQAAKQGAKVLTKELAKQGAKVTAPLLEAAAQSGSSKLVRDIVKKSVAKSLEGAREGAILGANQLLREDAIGKAEVNAESLLSYLGTGAATGGAFSAALVPGGALLSSLGGGLSKGLKKAGGILFDPEKDAARLMGLSDAGIAKLKQKAPGFVEELPDWLRRNFDLRPVGGANLVAQLDDIQAAAAQKMDDIIFKLDDTAKAKGYTLGPKLYSQIAQELEDNFVKPYSGMSSMRSFSSKARELVNDFRRLGVRKKAASFADLRDLRKKMDKLGKGFYKSMDPTEAGRAAYAARDMLNRTIKRYGAAVDEDLTAQFAEANQNYHYSAMLRPKVLKKEAAKRNLVSFQDVLLGTLGYGIGDVTGLSIAAANKLMHSDLKRKAVILAAVQKGAQETSKRIVDSVDNFLSGVHRPAKLTSINVLNKSALSAKENGEKPKKRVEAFRNVQENLTKLAANPQYLSDRLTKTTAPLAIGAPLTARAASDTLTRGVGFLVSKMPKSPAPKSLGIQTPYEPSSMELAQFERYVQVVDNPLSVLEDLQSGTLTREHVEALRSVYPNLYNEIRIQTANTLQERAEDNKPLSYNKRIQLGMLLDLPSDASLDPQFIVGMQQVFQNMHGASGQQGFGGQTSTQQPVGGVQPAVQTTQGGAENLSMSNREASDTQAFAARRNS